METQDQVGILHTTISDLCFDSIVNTHNFFGYTQETHPLEFSDNLKLRLSTKINSEYKRVHNRKPQPKEDGAQEPTMDYEKDIESIATSIQTISVNKGGKSETKKAPKGKSDVIIEEEQVTSQGPKSEIEKMIEELPKSQQEKLSKIPAKFLIFGKKDTAEPSRETALVPSEQGAGAVALPFENPRAGTVALGKIKRMVRPTWHAPWKLMRVISGHQGWVRCLAVDPSNQFFVTGSNDRTIKFWDLASGKLKITLTGHISAIRGLALSSRHAYLYSCAEDKQVKCWDLEYNKVIRSYHGHLSGVFAMSLHPTLDVLATGGRDSVVRLWDCRTKAQIHVLGGHTNAVSSIISQEFEPQIVSGSHDHTVRLWDIGSGKTIETLTNHKKAIRALRFHPEEYTFVSAAPDNMKVWKCPEGEFLRNVSGHHSIINDVAVNQDNVLVSCADDGSMKLWDWKSGYNFQTIESKPQPGSISSEAGIFCADFDKSSMRLITGECDKSIKIWKEDEDATEETHPIDLNWRPSFR